VHATLDFFPPQFAVARSQFIHPLSLERVSFFPVVLAVSWTVSFRVADGIAFVSLRHDGVHYSRGSFSGAQWAGGGVRCSVGKLPTDGQ